MFKNLLEDQNKKVKEVEETFERTQEDTRKEQEKILNKEKIEFENFNTQAQQEIEGWEKSIRNLVKSQTSGSSLDLFKKNVSDKKEEIQRKQQLIDVLKKTQEKELELRQKDHEKQIDNLKKEQAKIQQEKATLCYFMFDEVGTTGGKKILRTRYGLPTDRAEFDYSFFDLKLQSHPFLREQAQQMLYNSLIEASKKSKAIIEVSNCWRASKLY